ncbi:hypothetical protein [Gordonia sputi]|uniref:hypothetical protein n=1 Tax=Gordonia sputi TaxID=36823 RepID=UPI0036B1106D
MTDTASSEHEDQQEDPPAAGRARRWPRWVLGSLAATVPVAVALYTLAWTEHSTQVHDFNEAKQKCRESASQLVGDLDGAKRVAAQHAFETPPRVSEDYQTTLLNGVNEIEINCLHEPQLSGATEGLSDRWVGIRYTLVRPDMGRDMDSRVPGHSLEEVILDDASTFLVS